MGLIIKKTQEVERLRNKWKDNGYKESGDNLNVFTTSLKRIIENKKHKINNSLKNNLMT